jgi:hypothetical protein
MLLPARVYESSLTRGTRMSIEPVGRPPVDRVGAMCPLCGGAMWLVTVCQHTPFPGTDEYTFACWRCDIDRKYVVARKTVDSPRKAAQ